jgi:hypothetical protein
MDATWLVVWIIAGLFAVGYIGYLLYQLFYRLKNLVDESATLQKMATETREKAAAEDAKFEKAERTSPDSLFTLLGQRRKRKRKIEQKKRDRRRRLIDRISKIEVDGRFR